MSSAQALKLALRLAARSGHTVYVTIEGVNVGHMSHEAPTGLSMIWRACQPNGDIDRCA